jgi:hypothetical protein
MPTLTSSVGRGASNQKHDVALIQAVLASLPANPAAPFGQKLWTRPADGRATPDLEAAIRLFQSKNRISQSGRIDPMGPDIQTLDRALPPDRKGLAAVEQCTAVLCASVTASAVGQAQETLRQRTLLPGQAAGQLGDVARDLQKQTGLVLCPDGHGIDQQGRMIQRLTFADTHWMDASGRFSREAPLDKAREVVAALNRRPLPGLLEWHKGPMPFGSANTHLAQRVGSMPSAGGAMGPEVLAVRVNQGLRCLSGMHRPLDPDRMRRVGLNRTGDIVADRMLDVAATEIEAGNAGANELGIIGDILKGIFDDGANGIQRARADKENRNNSQVIQDLKKQIENGRILFQQGPIDKPELLGTARAQVQITEKLRTLILELSRLSSRPIVINDLLRASGRSHHARGRAVDIDESVAKDLLTIVAHHNSVDWLQIDEIIFDASVVGESDPNVWNFDRGRPHKYGERDLRNHRDHIHFAVWP